MATKLHEARVVRPHELHTLQYSLPAIWNKAAGLLKGKKIVDPVRYQRAIRKAWEARLQRQYRLGAGSHS